LIYGADRIPQPQFTSTPTEKASIPWTAVEKTRGSIGGIFGRNGAQGQGGNWPFKEAAAAQLAVDGAWPGLGNA
jgi:hypothetical protein